MSKMSKDFKVKSALRCMADGGMLGIQNRDAQLAAQERAILKPAAPAPVATPVAAPVPAGGMISDGVVSRPAPAPAAPVQPQGIFSRLRKAVGFADGGMPQGDAQRQALHMPAPGSQEERVALGRLATSSTSITNPLGYVNRADLEQRQRQRSASGSIHTPTTGTFPGMAAGGSPWDSSYAPGGSLSMQKAMPRPVAAAPSPVQPVAQPVAASPAAAPSPALAPPVSSTPTGGTHSIATANLQFGNGTPPPVGNWAGNPQTSATGYPILRSGGHVQGPGGPREDKVGPVMLSNDEYVLPAKTVRALGGPEELDELVQKTNDGRRPNGVEQREEKGEKRGLRGYSEGGPFYADANGNVGTEPSWKRVPAVQRAPLPGGGLAPIQTPPPSAGPTIDVTPERVPGFDGAKDITGEAGRAPKPVIDAPEIGSKYARAGNMAKGALRTILNPATVGFSAAVHSPEVGAQSDIVRDRDGRVTNMYLGQELTPQAKAMSDAERYKIMLRVNNGDQMAKELMIGANPVSSHIDPAAKYGLPPSVASPNIKPDLEPHGPPDEAPINPRQREGFDTQGSILRKGNNFYGGVTGEQGKAMEDAEAAKGRARYANDAQGMYAAIQGHIANGDLETANKLAWDSNSRALVSQGFAARQAARQAAAQPDESDGINSRYDKQAEKLSRYFRSDAAKGNLAKHLDALEGRRAAELGALRNTQASMRGQDIQSQTAAAKQASDAAIAAQRNQFEASKMQADQFNKDREYKLNVSKYGTEQAKVLHDQKIERETKNQTHIDRIAGVLLPGQDGKPDPAKLAAFSQFMHESQGQVFDLPPAERDRVIAAAANRFAIQQAANANTGWTGTTSNQLRDIKRVRPSQVSDIPQIGVLPYAAGKMVPFVNDDVAEFEDGNTRTVRSLGGRDNQDLKDIIYGTDKKSALRNK